MPDIIKRMWVDRVPRFVDEQQEGIDKWPAKTTVPVTTLVDAHMKISDILEGGRITGRCVEFYMRGEHMATLYYGEAENGFPRPLTQTTYHV